MLNDGLGILPVTPINLATNKPGKTIKLAAVSAISGHHRSQSEPEKPSTSSTWLLTP